MKKNKIFIKLFAMTAGVVVILLIIQFVFQYFWLEKFYVYNKKETVSNELMILKEKIETNEIHQEKIESSLIQYSMKNDIYISISNNYGVPQYEVNGEERLSFIQMKDTQNNTYKIYVDAFLDNNELIESLNQGKKIQVKGLLQDPKQKKVYPETITIDDRVFSAEKYQNSIESTVLIESENAKEEFNIDMIDEGLVNVEWIKIAEPIAIDLKGSIISINIMSTENYGIEYRRNQLLQEIFLFLGQEKNLKPIFENNKMMQYSKVDSFTGIKNIIFVQPLFIKNKEPMLMFAVSSLQPIEETTAIMKTYFLWVLVVAMFLAIVAAYFYSKKFTTPLLHLNGVTKDMAQLDFSQKCKIHTNDEIQDLAENINLMSNKLKITLEEVNKSNEKLKEDILFKEQMDQFRKTFIADASHELKTPLTVMKGICEGLVDEIYDCKDPQHIKNILVEINDMSELVYDLLKISKLESGKIPFKTSIFQLCDVLLKVHGKLKPLIENKGLQVSLSLSEDFVMADEDNIEKVIRNLYHNAIRYTPEKGTINISIHKEQDQCYFSIENSPAQIPKDELSKIWAPFYRIEKSRNKAFGGSGLGLHMVKEILDKHESQYGMENTEVGVKGYFFLKCVDSAIMK